MTLTFRRIPSSEVSPELVKVARRAARDAADILRLGDISIRWVDRFASEKAIGWIDPRWPDHVHLAADWCEQMGPEQTRALVFHECRHVWQEKTMRYVGYGEKARAEDDAESFSFRHTRTMIERPDYKWRYQDYV